MAKSKGITPEKLALIASAREYLIDVISSAVARALPGVGTDELITKQTAYLARKERELIEQIEKLDA